jgi:PAS domain S-box-containing protein
MTVEDRRPNILLVDDREENLLALDAILEPLGHRLVKVTSGVAALKELLLDDFACILLDVQMPELDGFEVATLIKQRKASEHIPIVFVTALSKEDKHVYRGYSAGAVDYIFKPIDPEVLRSKIGVFIDLWDKSRQIREQAARLHEQELTALEQASEERYRQLADAMPQIVWTADPTGGATYFNRRWFEYTGMSPGEAGPNSWYTVVHPDDLPAAVSRREQTLRSGDTFEIEYRFRRADGGYRWHLGRAVPMRKPDGTIDFWIGTATDIHDRKLIEDQRTFIVAASDTFAQSLDYRKTLGQVAELAAGAVADWCAVHILEPDETVSEVAVALSDPARVTFARELQERYPPTIDDATGVGAVIRSGQSELVPEFSEELLDGVARDELHGQLLRQLEPRSYMCVPLQGRDRVLGAMTFISTDSGRLFGPDELIFAEELARRAASAIENARLYREAEARAQAARVLATIGDGVLLVDATGRVRLWNPAAERITGIVERDVIGRFVADAIPGWGAVESPLPVAQAGEAVRAETVLLDLGERELWLSVSAVGYEEGTVFAFRDLTEELALETMRHDLVATVSHELRTPLAAIYGAALTLRRDDLELQAELHEKLLEVIVEEANRLAEIVNDLLLASQLDAGTLKANIERCDPREIAELEIDAARTHLPGNVDLLLDASDVLPPVAADSGQLRQVLSNLIDNAIKYSPAGGIVNVAIAPNDRHVRFSVRDSGLGIPPAEQLRIFDKFYRLDPHMARGIGGTGLGLYICRELVRRVDGRIWVESDGGSGSTFHVEIPQDKVTAGSNGRSRRAVTTA